MFVKAGLNLNMAGIHLGNTSRVHEPEKVLNFPVYTGIYGIYCVLTRRKMAQMFMFTGAMTGYEN